MDFKFKKRTFNKTGNEKSGKIDKPRRQQQKHEKTPTGKTTNSKIRFDDDGNQIETQKLQKFKNKPKRSRDLIQDDDIGSRWYEEVSCTSSSKMNLKNMIVACLIYT